MNTDRHPLNDAAEGYTMAGTEKVVEYFKAYEPKPAKELLHRSDCHEYDGGWTPEPGSPLAEGRVDQFGYRSAKDREAANPKPERYKPPSFKLLNWTPEEKAAKKKLERGLDPVGLGAMKKATKKAGIQSLGRMRYMSTRTKKQEQVRDSLGQRMKAQRSMITFSEGCELMGILPSHLARLVADGNVTGDRSKKMVSKPSLEAYFATR